MVLHACADSPCIQFGKIGFRLQLHLFLLLLDRLQLHLKGSPKKDEPATRTGMSAHLHNAFAAELTPRACSRLVARGEKKRGLTHISLGPRMPRTGCRVLVKGSVATEVQSVASSLVQVLAEVA